MSSPNPIIGSNSPAGAMAYDAETVAAELLLREVKALLLQGQPRHAIAHICAVTGVDQPQAASFVAELQTGVFG